MGIGENTLPVKAPSPLRIVAIFSGSITDLLSYQTVKDDGVYVLYEKNEMTGENVLVISAGLIRIKTPV